MKPGDRPFASMSDSELAFAAHFGLRVVPKAPERAGTTTALSDTLVSEIAREVAARGWGPAEVERRADEFLRLLRLKADALDPAY